ncbi:MAG TPA: histidinol-phosphate transaminase [Chloroflexota bacterium]|nr:histidinol-phosphate transaminase [Chloroflexota bacterium]
MPFQVRPELSDVSPVAHGSAPAAELRPTGGQGPPVIDFSVSTNPLGPPPSVLAAVTGLSQRDVWRYPDPTARALREAIAAQLGTDPDEIVAGNGSAELIWTLALAAVRPRPEEVLILGPTFGEYERASRLLGAGVDVVRAGPEAGFLLDVARVAGRIRQRRPRVVWLCNPNNPTGRYLPPPDVQALLEAATDAGALLVIDEAYAPFVDRATPPLPFLSGGHLVLLRSLTKDYALAGLRLGYAVTTPGLAASLRLAQPPWSVSAPAQAAGLAALAEPGYLDRAREVLREARARLVAGLRELGLRVTPPAANFVLVEVGDAATFRAALRGQGCIVRDCTSFGLPRHIRIGVRTPPECDRLLRAVQRATRKEGA